jgi:hypothetical protein
MNTSTYITTSITTIIIINNVSFSKTKIHPKWWRCEREKKYQCEAPLRIHDKTVSIFLTSNKTSLAKYKKNNKLQYKKHKTQGHSRDIDQVHNKLTSKTKHINNVLKQEKVSGVAELQTQFHSFTIRLKYDAW